jgi:protein PhnA
MAASVRQKSVYDRISVRLSATGLNPRAIKISSYGNNQFNTGYSMSGLPNCPKCDSEYTYEDGNLYVCPECAHEWGKDAAEVSEDEVVVNDANGNPLKDGDTVTVIKDLKVKGSSSVVKVGTKVKNIRLVDGDHDIDCKVDGIGAMKLKSEFVKKV